MLLRSTEETKHGLINYDDGSHLTTHNLGSLSVYGRKYCVKSTDGNLNSRHPGQGSKKEPVESLTLEPTFLD
jgi:hypothetical protein